jgi:hypothetical protein
LIFIQIKSPESLEFNHKYTFTLLVYSLIFALWMLWVNRYSNLFFTATNKRKSEAS